MPTQLITNISLAGSGGGWTRRRRSAATITAGLLLGLLGRCRCLKNKLLTCHALFNMHLFGRRGMQMRRRAEWGPISICSEPASECRSRQMGSLARPLTSGGRRRGSGGGGGEDSAAILQLD